jgi:hypothetical protein
MKSCRVSIPNFYMNLLLEGDRNGRLLPIKINEDIQDLSRRLDLEALVRMP